MSHVQEAGQDASRKRKRLTHACSQCRARKVRCDEKHPKCSNCERSGAACVTFDPRNPDVAVQRREAQKSLDVHNPLGVYSPASSDAGLLRDAREPSFASPHGRQMSGTDTINQAEDQPPPSRELLPALPRHTFGHGSSLHMLSQWLDLAFVRLGMAQSFSKNIDVVRSGSALRSASRIPVCPLSTITEHEIIAQAENFMSTVNTVFPIFSQTSMHDLLSDWDRLRRGESELPLGGMTSILVSLIVATDSKVPALPVSKLGLGYALSNLHLICIDGSLRSVQALLLLVLHLRCHDELVLASNMINLAASVSQALGLHRRFSQKQMREIGELQAREQNLIWWSVYALEKIISLELGRLSTIRDFECNQLPPELVHFQSEAMRHAFQGLIDLAKLQSEINERFALSRAKEESTSNIEIEILAKMEMAGELDQKLLDWDQSLAPYTRPSNYSSYSSDVIHALSFLALQYWQTLFLLHRNALLLSSVVVGGQADTHFQDRPFRFRLRSGRSICCNAARAMVSIMNNVEESESVSILMSSHAPLIAVYALGIHVLRNPKLGLARADFEIQADAIRMITDHQYRIGIYDDPEPQALRNLIGNLQSQVSTRLSVRDLGTPSPQQQFGPSSIGAAAQGRGTEHDGTLGQTTVLETQQINPFDASIASLDIGFDMDAMNSMDIDWDALALAYDLPS